MKTYRFAYGSGTVEFPLEEKNIIGELHGNVVEPISDIRRELWASLDTPIDSAPLCRRVTPGSTVALVVSDMSRFWMRQDLVVPHLVDYLTQRCGVREDDITIVIANGTHTGGDEAELRTLVTDAVYDRITVETITAIPMISSISAQRPTARRSPSIALRPWRTWSSASARQHIM